MIKPWAKIRQESWVGMPKNEDLAENLNSLVWEVLNKEYGF